MDANEFNKYLDDLLTEAKIECEMSEFTQEINQIISQTEFDESKQAFLFISIDNIDKPESDVFISHAGNARGHALLLQAINKFNKTHKADDEES